MEAGRLFPLAGETRTRGDSLKIKGLFFEKYFIPTCVKASYIRGIPRETFFPAIT